MAKSKKSVAEQTAEQTAEQVATAEECAEMLVSRGEDAEIGNQSTNIINEIMPYEKSILPTVLSRNGIELDYVDETENGIFVNIKSDDGEEMVTEVTTTEDEKEAYKAITALQNHDKLSGIYKAWYMSKVGDLAKDAGYKSVGAFLAAQFKGLKVNSCNQLVAVANTFIVEEEQDGTKYPVYRYEWLKGVTVTNMAQLLGFFNKVTEGINDKNEKGDFFYKEYIVTKKVSLRRTLADLKDQLKALSEPKKQANKQDDNKQDAPKLSTIPETEEVIIAKAIAISEKHNRHDIALLLNELLTDKTEQVTEQATEQVTEQVTEQATEQA